MTIKSIKVNQQTYDFLDRTDRVKNNKVGHLDIVIDVTIDTGVYAWCDENGNISSITSSELIPCPDCGRVYTGKVYCWVCDGFYDDCSACERGFMDCQTCNGTGQAFAFEIEYKKRLASK